jgi:hypothetical protein
MKRKPSPRRRKQARPARSPRPKAPQPQAPPVEGPRPSPLPLADAAELLRPDGRLRLPPALRGDLKAASDELVAWLARDPAIGDEMTGGELLLMQTCIDRAVVHGFALAVARYARDLKRVPELQETFKRRSLKANKAKRKTRGAGGMTRDERDAAIVAEYAALITRMPATEAQFDLADKYELGDKQVRNILAAARKAAR